jgi:hypothetical protein
VPFTVELEIRDRTPEALQISDDLQRLTQCTVRVQLAVDDQDRRGDPVHMRQRGPLVQQLSMAVGVARTC